MSKKSATTPLASRVRAYLKRRSWSGASWFTAGDAARHLHAEPVAVLSCLREQREAGRAWNVRERWYGRPLATGDDWT